MRLSRLKFLKILPSDWIIEKSINSHRVLRSQRPASWNLYWNINRSETSPGNTERQAAWCPKVLKNGFKDIKSWKKWLNSSSCCVFLKVDKVLQSRLRKMSGRAAILGPMVGRESRCITRSKGLQCWMKGYTGVIYCHNCIAWFGQCFRVSVACLVVLIYDTNWYYTYDNLFPLPWKKHTIKTRPKTCNILWSV